MAACCLIGLGSNVGDRSGMLDRATDSIAAHPEVRGISRSRWHATRPVGGPGGQGEYLNGVVRLQTGLGPRPLREVLRGIEESLGRQRRERWDSRSIDLDLLLYADRVIDDPDLVVPHPRMSFRRFVLAPAAEVAAEMVHPVIGWTIEELLRHLDSAADYVAITGPPGAGKSWLAQRLCEKLGGRLAAPDADAHGSTQEPGSSPGQNTRAAIRFLHLHAKALAECESAMIAAGGGPRGSSGLVASDFWLGQLLAHASVELSGEDFSRFKAHWQTVSRGVMQPKLLVVLDAPLARLVERCGLGAEHLHVERLERLRQAIQNQTKFPGHGPTLWYLGDDLDEALVEVVAAVEALH
jgi:2-amino-4-hydroxy-6-hydroxymethyldihydropteridine diphosphokinase